MAWVFYVSKFIDMFDSFFFVLKKKFSHLSFLHVFHHGIMPFECWWGTRLYLSIIVRISGILIIDLLAAAMEALQLFLMLAYTL